ncbi:hypothetical protein QM042_02530 [Escherichia coli]
MCNEGEKFGDIVDATLRTLKVRAEVADDPSGVCSLCVVEQSEAAGRILNPKTARSLLELVVSGDIKKVIGRIREVEYGIICDMCRNDYGHGRGTVDAGQACDGGAGGFAGQVARLVNELPMIKQEAKSYAVHRTNDLLDPYRFEAAQDRMTVWATSLITIWRLAPSWGFFKLRLISGYEVPVRSMSTRTDLSKIMRISQNNGYSLRCPEVIFLDDKAHCSYTVCRPHILPDEGQRCR